MPKHNHVQTEQTTQDQTSVIADQIDAIDQLTACLSQADAVVTLLMNNGERIDVGFTLSHKLVIDALWAVSELIDRAKDAAAKIEGAA